MTDNSADSFDVVVIGAGPAGCAAATVLADHGRRVALLEREALPRYRIGESLIPHCWFPLDRLGIVDAVDQSGFVVPKHSVQFVNTEGKLSKPFYFFEHTDHPKAKTWQVTRAEFDQLLVGNAEKKGVDVRTRTTVKELLRDGAGKVVGVSAEGADGARCDVHATVTVDASGRDLFSASKNRWRVADQHLNKVALWTYYEGARRDPGVDEGATTIAYVPEKGWFWYLPLANDLVSVGIVGEPDYLFGEERDHETIFEREVALQPWIAEHLAPGRRVREFRVTRDFSYRSLHCAEDGLVLAGDAFAFLDPVFSSGVYLALQGGVMAGDAVEAALAAGDPSAERFADYGAHVCRQLEGMRQLVHAFYDERFNFGDFFKVHPDRRADVTDVLIGDLDRDFSALFEAMREFAEIPMPLAYGGPLVPDERVNRSE